MCLTPLKCQALGQVPRNWVRQAKPSFSPSCGGQDPTKLRGHRSGDTLGFTAYGLHQGTVPHHHYIPYPPPLGPHPEPHTSTHHLRLHFIPLLVNPQRQRLGFALSAPCLFQFTFAKVSKDSEFRYSRQGWWGCFQIAFSQQEHRLHFNIWFI